MPRTFRWTWLGALALATCPTLALGQEIASHTVRSGDTLWDLARQYRGDPFLWPDIYRLNTGVVEDPHWIYPGEQLHLTGADSVPSVPTVDTPAPLAAATDSLAAVAESTKVAVADSSAADSTAPAPEVATYAAPDTPATPSLTELTRPTGDAPPRLFGPPPGQTMQETLRAYTEQPYRPLRASEFYSSGFLTEGQKLPFGKVLGPVTPPQIPANAANVPALPFWILAVEAPRGATYQIGDTLLIAQLGRPMRSHGDVVEPTGLARVTDTTLGRYLVEVVAIYGSILRDQQVLPLEKFTPGGSAHAVAVSEGVRATLLGGPRRQEVKTPQMIVFLDRGRRDGVAPGDIFELRRRAEELPDGSVRADELMATLQIVHVRERTATGRLLRIISSDIAPGTTARQVAKLPS